MKKAFDFRDFSRVEVGGAFEVELVYADSFGIVVDAPENLFPHIRIHREGETLRIDYAWHFFDLVRRVSIPRARVTMPDLRVLHLHGASRGTVAGFSSAEDFRLKLAGASSLSGTLSTGNANISVSGASRLTLEGDATNMVLEASGASNAALGEFRVGSAQVVLSGASHGVVQTDGRLGVNLSGASSLRYAGTPTMGDVSITGASSLARV